MNGIPHYLFLTVLLASALGRKRSWIALPLSLLLWVPFQPHLLGIVHSATGNLSVGSMILAILLAIKLFKGTPILAHPGLKPTVIIIALLSIPLYGNYLGLLPLGGFYPYENAFFSPLPLLAIALFAAVASCRGWLWPALWSLISLCLWRLDLHPSLNPWDILLDPVVAMASIAASIRILLSR